MIYGLSLDSTQRCTELHLLEIRVVTYSPSYFSQNEKIFNFKLFQDLPMDEEIVVHLPDFDPVDVDHFINSIYGWREHKDDIFITQLHKLLRFGTHWMGKGPDFHVETPMEQAQFIAIFTNI